MDSMEKRLLEGRVDYTKWQHGLRERGRRVIGPGGGPSRKTIRAESDESRNEFHRYEQSVLREEARRRGGA